mgnify:CR=1 FL=1
MTDTNTVDKLRVSVVGRMGPLWAGRARYVSVPAVDGRLGILSGRQPVLAALQAGVVEIQPSTGETVKVQVDDGFASVDSDFVTVVVEGGKLGGGTSDKEADVTS